MQRFLQFLLFLSYYYITQSVQPNFPPQIVFSISDDQTLYAIDEINQRAYVSYSTENGYVFKNIPYATPDSPQAQNYVQLIAGPSTLDCMYETYWKYGGSPYNLFPSHWHNQTSFQVQNFLNFKYPLIHSLNFSDTEDYWYANTKCYVDSGEYYPCQEIYFKKNTNIPLRYTEVIRRGWDIVQSITEYNVKSVGKLDEKYFEIPKNWSDACRDVMLGIYIVSQTTKIPLQQSDIIQVWLPSPPHRVDGNDTVTIRWSATEGCSDCLTWTPKELAFNIENFQERQNVTITRVKNGPKTILNPIFNGGGFDLVPSVLYPAFIE